jgi:hypothetical protein
MDPPLAKTITGSFDHRYPENEMVLGINIDAGIRAYPLLEVKREGGVINDELGDVHLVVFAGPRPQDITMSAFSRLVDDQVLTFGRSDSRFRDRETQSTWTIEGKAISGPLAGRRLQPLRWQYVRWHAWVYPHPFTDLFLSSQPRPKYPGFPQRPEVESFRDILADLASNETELTFSHTLAELTLPHEATAGICVYLGDDRLNLYAFASPAAAEDYVALEGAWFCMPFDAKIARKRALRIGPVVLESNPAGQFAEPTQTVRYPDNEIAWAACLQQHREPATNPSDAHVVGHFMSLIRHLKDRRYDVVEAAFLPHSQQRVGTISAIAATIEADRFAIYRCPDEPTAAAVAKEVTHAIHEGCWVLRSIPVLMYADPHYEMGQLPDDEIAWSPLLDDDRFRTALKEFAHRS